MGILTSSEIGAKLREIRKLRGMTQEQLAERIEVTFQQIQQYESGSTRLNTDRLQAVAAALSVSVSAFFCDENGHYLAEDEQQLLNGFRALTSDEVRKFVLNSLTPRSASKSSERI